MNKVILPITVNIPTSSYFALSLQLGVILAHKETKEWYYENFINIYMERHNNICFTEMSFGMLCRYTTVFDYSVSKYEDTVHSNIVDRVRHELLDEQNYAYLYVDEYYISCKKAYMNYHFHHQALIYGFDDDKRVFNAIAFDKSGHFAELEYRYDEVVTGYEEAFKCEPETKNDTFGVVFFKIRPDFSHKLNPTHMIHSLAEYASGCVPKNLHYVQHNMPQVAFRQDYDCVFGLNVIKKTAALFQMIRPEEYTFVDFRRVHFLYEHAAMLLERFRYIGQAFSLDSTEYAKFVSKYESITTQYMTIRLMVLKMQQIMRTVKDTTARKHASERIGKDLPKKLLAIYSEEKQVVTQIVRFLSALPTNHDQLSFSYDVLPQAKIRQEYANAVELQFTKPCGVESLTFDCISDVRICINNEYFDDFYHFPSLDKTTRIILNRSVQKITFESLSEKQLCYQDMNIRLVGGNVLLGKKITASSQWHGDDGKQIDRKCLPEKAIDGDKNSYWRAAEQKNGYDGSDWLEADLGEAETINTVVIDELDYSPRLKKYTLWYTDGNDREMILLTHDFVPGQPNVHRFPTISAKKLKIAFEECEAEQLGYFEPIIRTFEAYNVVETCQKKDDETLFQQKI